MGLPLNDRRRDCASIGCGDLVCMASACGSGERICSLTNQGLLYNGQMVVNACTDAVENVKLTHVVERYCFGGGSVMVWGGIAYGEKMPLVVINGNLNALQYHDPILSTAVPYAQQHQLMLQQNNDRPHFARICLKYLQIQNVDPFEWPPNSSYLSPIDHFWDEIDRHIRRRPETPPPESSASD